MSDSPKTKQVIVIRKDLNMRKGKMVAQGAHASLKVFLDSITSDSESEITIKLQPDMLSWISGTFTKICLGVDSENELDTLYELAKNSGLPCSMIIDNGVTEFSGVKTKTCIAIGPADSVIIDKITSHLKLLRKK